MKTDELISLLAQQNSDVDRRASSRRFVWALTTGLAAAGVMAALILGVRSDLDKAIHLPIFWWKLTFAVSLAGAALVMTQRLARPGRQLGVTWLGLAVPLVAAAGSTSVVVLLAPPEARLALIQGGTWLTCLFLIALLSAPAFLGIFWAIKGLAPTCPRAAGAAGGLLAGAVATIAYCVYCPELEIPSWATWYTLGMLIPTVVGAALGPRLLRW